MYPTNSSERRQEWFKSFDKNSSDDEIIDAILFYLFETQLVIRPFENRPEFLSQERIIKIVEKIKDNNLAIIPGLQFSNFNFPLKITSYGNKIIEDDGGWLKNLQSIKNDSIQKKIREEEAHNANILSSKAAQDSAKSAKSSKNWAIGGVIFSVLSFLVSFTYQCEAEIAKEESLIKIKNDLSVKDSILMSQKNQLLKLDSVLNSLSKKTLNKMKHSI